MAHVLDFYQGSTTLFDMASLTTTGLLTWSVDSYPSGQYSQDSLTFHLRGSSIDNLFENMVTLNRVLLAAEDNAARAKKNAAYTPIFLRFQAAGATNLVRSEVFGESLGKIQNVLNREAIFGKMVKDISFTVKRRPYFEESAAVALAGSPFSVTNNAGQMNVASTDVRGDLPAPLRIKLRSEAQHNGIIAALRSPAAGTVDNFLSILEAESYAARGANVADLTDATFSPGSGTSGQQWTPAVTTEQLLIRWQISSNVQDQLGPIRVIAAVKDEAAAANTKIRVKSFTYTGTTRVYGDWGDSQKFVTSVGARTIVDCGIVVPSGIDTSGMAPTGIGYELWGQATAAGASYKFDVDCIYLLPTYDGGYESGYIKVGFPAALGVSTTPDGVLDAHDRMPTALLVDGSDNLIFGANDIRGLPLFAYPGRAAKLIVLLYSTSDGVTVFTLGHTVTVTYTPRYRTARGST